MRHFISILALVFFSACIGEGPIAQGDAGSDATTTDAAADVATDAGGDDATADAGPSISGDVENVYAIGPSSGSYGVATDTTGDMVITGVLTGSTTIGTFNFASASGSRDGLVIRLAANNGYKWAKLLGGDQTEDAYGVALDSAGDVYVVGDFNAGGASGKLTPLGTKSLTATHASYNSYVAKLDGATGSTDWVVSFDGATAGNNTCYDVAVGPTSVVVGCGVSGGLSYKDTNNQPQTRTAGTQDLWLADLDPATGNVKAGCLIVGNATGDTLGFGTLVVDAQDNVYLGGQQQSGSLTGDTPAFTINRKGTNSFAFDGFVLKLGAGTPRTFGWSQVYGAGLFYTYNEGLGLAKDGSLYVTGRFSGTRDFGKGQVTAAGSYDQFVTHLAAGDGSTLQQTTFGGNGVAMYSGGIAVDDVGNPVVNSHYGGPAFNFAGHSLPSTNGQTHNALFTKFSPDLATVDYSLLTQAQGDDAGIAGGVHFNAIAVNPSTGQAVVSGGLNGTADLGDGNQTTKAVGLIAVRHKR